MQEPRVRPEDVTDMVAQNVDITKLPVLKADIETLEGVVSTVQGNMTTLQTQLLQDPVVDVAAGDVEHVLLASSRGKMVRITHGIAISLNPSNFYDSATGTCFYPGFTIRIHNNGNTTLALGTVNSKPTWVTEGGRLFIRPNGVAAIKDMGNGQCLCVGALQSVAGV